MASQTAPPVSVKAINDFPGDNSTDTTLSEALITLRKRRLVLVIAVLLGAAYGLYKAYTQPIIYNAFATIEVRSGSSSEYKVDASQGFTGDTSGKMSAEVVIIQSDTLMLTVAKEMNLANNPEFLGAKGPVPFRSLDNPGVRESVVNKLHAQLKVVLIPKTDIIRLSYASSSAKLSADIVNKVVADYIQRSYESRYQSTQRVSQWLSGQLDDLKRQVETSQEQVLDMGRRLGMLGLDPTHNEISTALDTLATAAAQARIARILAESRYRVLEGMDPNTIDDSLGGPQSIVPPLLNQIRGQLATAKASLASLQATLGPNHPQVKSAQAQVVELQQEANAELGRILAQAKENYVIAKANQEQTLDALETQKAEAYKMRDDMVEYTLRQHEFESSRLLYDGLVQRLRTAGIEAGLESLEIDPIDQALPPAHALLESKSTIILIDVVVALLLGIITAFLLESLDTGLRSIAEIEAITQLPSLAIVPKVKRMVGEQTENMSVAQRNIAALSSPKSQFAEALRSLRTALLLSHSGKPPKFILFTSSTPSEGKTTIASNLACVLAQGETRVLLLDGDLRRPNVHPRFGLSGKIGLSTLLTGGTTFEETLQHIPEAPNLDILASGPVPPFPAELLSSDAMRALLLRCADLYDYVVIDSPPILSVTDGVILARDADAVVLVVRHGKSGKHVVRRARDLLVRAGAPITGIVLNAVDLNSPEYQGYYGRSGYHYSGVDSETWEPQRAAEKKSTERRG